MFRSITSGIDLWNFPPKKEKKAVQVKVGDLLVQFQTAGPKIPDRLSTAVMARMPVCLPFPRNDPHWSLAFQSLWQTNKRSIKSEAQIIETLEDKNTELSQSQQQYSVLKLVWLSSIIFVGTRFCNMPKEQKQKCFSSLVPPPLLKPVLLPETVTFLSSVIAHKAH